MFMKVQPQFFRTTTGIKLGLHAFDKPRLGSLWPFLAILGVTKILCNFRLVIKQKIGK